VQGLQGQRIGVRREDFIPDEVWVRDDDGFYWVPLRRADDPERWLRLCRADDPVVIQVDDGDNDGKGIFPTSSSTALWLMARMLDLLDVRQEMNVLEVGTGTGYNAALLAEKTQTGHVTTMELDPAIADHARTVLRKAGMPVTVVTGDGTLGHVQRAPYDRVVATAAASTVPLPVGRADPTPGPDRAASRRRLPAGGAAAPRRSRTRRRAGPVPR
jgi:ribosomal protein L11 methylase PrmA